MKITKSFTPRDATDWRSWLEKNHNSEGEVWLVYFKAGSGRTNIDYETSIEDALCFGWIDGVIQRIDGRQYARRFTPRRRESKWSETNKRRIRKVICEGRITEAGLACVTFDVTQVKPVMSKPKRSPVRMPLRIKKALQADPKIWALFQEVTPSLKRTYILWLSDAKKPETFERRLKKAIGELRASRPTSMH